MTGMTVGWWLAALVFWLICILTGAFAGWAVTLIWNLVTGIAGLVAP